MIATRLADRVLDANSYEWSGLEPNTRFTSWKHVKPLALRHRVRVQGRYGGPNKHECYQARKAQLLARKMPDFAYDPSTGRFKSWLYTVVSGRIIDLRRRKVAHSADTDELECVVDPQPTPTEAWEEHWRNEHLRYCMEQARLSVSERNYRAFRMLLDGTAVNEVGQALEMNANQVYKAKAQVLQEVRRIMERIGA